MARGHRRGLRGFRFGAGRGAEPGYAGSGAEVDNGPARILVDRRAKEHRFEPGAMAGPTEG